MILLDTHIFIWLNLNPKKIPRTIAKAIDKESSLCLAAISLWETAMLIERRRITLPIPSLREWFQMALSAPNLHLLPLTPDVASRSEGLKMRGDPADRLIAATALEHGHRLATVDGNLIGLDWLPTIPEPVTPPPST